MKIAVKTILLVVLLLIGMIVDSIAPIITNDLAMTQMENSNALFVVMSSYNQFKPIVSITFGIVICLVAFSLARDLVKFAKSSER